MIRGKCEFLSWSVARTPWHIELQSLNDPIQLEPCNLMASFSRERYADFHALCYTWATFLQRNGVAQRFAMKLMRHSDIKLTAKVYTDETQLPIYDAIKGLPRLLGYTQIRAQISGAAGQNVAQPVAASEGNGRAETPVNGGVCHSLAHGDAVGKMERAKGFESFRS